MSEAETIATLAEALVSELVAADRTVAAAESCTGGWIAKALTDVSGSSQVFGYGIVSYSNSAKDSLLGVPPAAIEQHGAVSETVVRAMVEGVKAVSNADLAVAVSGVAGPDGGTAEKPVGTVWFAWAQPGGEVSSERRHFAGGRDDVRRQTVIHALQGLREILRNHG